MAAALAAVARGVRAALADIFPTGDVADVRLDGDGSGAVQVRLGPGCAGGAAVTVTYADPDAYPSSAALVLSDDKAAAARLEGLAERFQDRAPLTVVLCKVRVCVRECCVDACVCLSQRMPCKPPMQRAAMQHAAHCMVRTQQQQRGLSTITNPHCCPPTQQTTQPPNKTQTL